MNSATFLLNFFLAQSGGKESVPRNYADLAAALADVDAALHVADINGDEEAKLAASCMPELWKTLSTECLKNNNDFTYTVFSLKKQDQMALLTAKRLLDSKVAEYSEERRASIKELVDGIPGLLRELTLPEQLKLYVLRLVQEVDLALTEYETTSDFKLDVAFSRLQTSLNSIAVVPKPQEQQNKLVEFFNNTLIPCLTVLSLATGIPNDALQSYQIYTQIDSSSQQTSVAQPPNGMHQTADGSKNPDSHE